METLKDWIINLIVTTILLQLINLAKCNYTAHLRQKRSTPRPLTDEEKIRCVFDHNTYRAKAGAANMEYMQWNSVLADMATEWAKQCRWEHGQPTNFPKEYNSLGQNLYYISNGVFRVTDGMKHWHDEIADYDFNNVKCNKEPCGHYTQMVWGTSNEIGCGAAFCPTLLNGHQDSYYFVCNYRPPGNYKGQQPFIKGSSCSKCPQSSKQCFQGLCRDCQKDKVNCECSLLCANCGTLNKTSCSCECQPGWWGPFCTVQCVDKRNCDGYNKQYCDNGNEFRPFMERECPVYCGFCKAQDKSSLMTCAAGSLKRSIQKDFLWYISITSLIIMIQRGYQLIL